MHYSHNVLLVIEPQEQYFELFRIKNRQKILGLCPLTPLWRAYSTPQTPYQSKSFSPRFVCQKINTPKNCWMQHWKYELPFMWISFQKTRIENENNSGVFQVPKYKPKFLKKSFKPILKT